MGDALSSGPTAVNTADPAAISRALQAVTEAASSHRQLASVTRPVTTASAATSAGTDAVLPLHPILRELCPWPGGLRRGATLAVTGSRTLLWAVLASIVATGQWAAVVGDPSLGMVAAAEHGLPLDRLAIVADPGPDWPSVVAQLLDGLPVVAVNTTGPVSASTARALSARARRAGSLLIPMNAQWPGWDLTLTATGKTWHGLKAGRGRLRQLKDRSGHRTRRPSRSRHHHHHHAAAAAAADGRPKGRTAGYGGRSNQP
ncbi:hypothetical protein GCM10010123_02150 [Pilimelia anulata]|uniref:Uncharacterized protein n=1 Tax=Pilimelia anulata TaxID=53371 RepID=A0A8J3F830_9ACTN|nr:hypothetical protein [Pilimelia anulata]GGJ75805.1 hypothetical protein GCM10010123_02150 [Pilimelia anulata]